MIDLNTFVDLAQTAPLIAVFYFMWKAGIIKIGKNGNGKKNGYQLQIDILTKHAETSNSEVGKIQKDIVLIKERLGYIKGVVSRLK